MLLLYQIASLFLVILCVVIFKVIRSIKARTIWFGPKLNSDEYPPQLNSTEITYARLSVLGGEKIAVYMSGKMQQHLPWVVYCHGMLTNCEQDLSIFTELQNVANVVAWDYRGFGRSTGLTNEHLAVYDLHYIITWLEECFEVNTQENVVLLGRSLGTNVILQYVRDRQFLPRRLILCHPFYSFRDVFSAWELPSPLAYLVGNMNVRGVMKQYLSKNLSRSILLIGTAEDNVTPWETACAEAKEIIEAQCELHDIGGDHFKPPAIMWEKIRNKLFIR